METAAAEPVDQTKTPIAELFVLWQQQRKQAELLEDGAWDAVSKGWDGPSTAPDMRSLRRLRFARAIALSS